MAATASTVRRKDTQYGLRGFLFLEGFVRLLIWYTSLCTTWTFFTAWGGWPKKSVLLAAENYSAAWNDAWPWCCAISNFILLFNVVYLLELLSLRLILRVLPFPKEGEFTFGPGKPLNPSLLVSAFVAILVRARYQAPFPGFLVFHIANIPPFCWLTNWILGPKSKSCLVLDPPIPDPDLTEIGQNVIIGNMTSIIAHTQYRDTVSIRKTVIEDDVMIGAHALVYSGCRIKRGAVVYGGAIVPPNTVIGENEAWGGVPARKIKDLPPLET